MLTARRAPFDRRLFVSTQCLLAEPSLDDKETSMAKEGWYSLAGYLHIKVLGGAFTYLKPRRRHYFVLDEVDCRLIYFKDETDFIRKKEAVGHIDLRHSGVTLNESNARAFVIQSVSSFLSLLSTTTNT
uniref:PH domain-containing protein n=1 Tax=Plectus sambesii TaxID=2011161 RepID=A0A914XH68_9BILA